MMDKEPVSMKEPIVSRWYQLSFIAKFVRTVLVGALLYVLIFYFYTNAELGERYHQALLIILKLLEKLIPAILLTSSLTVIVVLVMMWLLTLIKSNKIAGPVYRLEQNLELIARGDLTMKTKFREGDAVSRISDDLTAATESLSMKFGALLEDARGIREEAEKLDGDPGRPPDDLLAKIRAVKVKLLEFKAE